MDIVEQKTKLENNVKAWFTAQHVAVKVGMETAGGVLQGGIIGALMGSLSKDLAATMAANPSMQGQQTASFNALAGGPVVQGRNFAVMTGVNALITAVLKRTRGEKDDPWNTVTASFGSGAAFSLVSGMAGPNKVAGMITTGVAFGLFQLLFWNIGKAFGGNRSEEEESQYQQTDAMLYSLGLSKYEKNFRNGLINDRCLSLVTDSALADCKIPPGPRLLILEHVATTDYSLPPLPPAGASGAPNLPGMGPAY
mmetsp:Transcript_11260/g.41228  ORF Transcript_11260/g.41228 Transcript_11260/m.41228 type:complete len:253 (-) Transcript_11260:143-901(-)